MRRSYGSWPMRLLRAVEGLVPGSFVVWWLVTDASIAASLKRWLAPALAGLVAAYTVRALLISVVVGERFITVRNVFWTHTVPRSMLREATLDGEATVWVGPGSHGGGPRCLLLRTDRRFITVTATAWLPRGAQQAVLREMRGIAARARSRQRRQDRSA